MNGRAAQLACERATDAELQQIQSIQHHMEAVYDTYRGKTKIVVSEAGYALQ